MNWNSKKTLHLTWSTILLVVITIITQYSSPSPAYELDTKAKGGGYFSFRDTYAQFTFSQSIRYENFSGKDTQLIAQTWLHADKFPPNSEEIKLFPSTAKNDTEKRFWYWNKQFLDYVTFDINNLLSLNFSDITLTENLHTALKVNVSSSVFTITHKGDPVPTRTDFDPSLIGINFNVTYLPLSMSHYTSKNVTSEDWDNLERWERTTFELEKEIQAKWYVANFTITQGGICLGYYVTNPFLEPMLGLVVLTVISLTLFKKRKRS